MARDVPAALKALRFLQASGQRWMREHVSTPAQVAQATHAHATALRVDLAALPPVLHIAGSKGKGSTAAFAESLLRRGLGLRTGLFTSPHLVSPTERFRIAGCRIDEELFLREFWAAWDVLGGPADAEAARAAGWAGPSPPLPGFNLLTLLAFKIFTDARVDVLVLETGLGGRFDATNVVQRPAACAITTLDLEHTELLGPTLRDIAWQKAGILKPGVPAVVAAPQPDEAMAMIAEVAADVGAPLFCCAPRELLLARAPGLESLGLEGRFQLINASVALGLVELFQHQLHEGRVKLGVGGGLVEYREFGGGGSATSGLTPATRRGSGSSFGDAFGASIAPAIGRGALLAKGSSGVAAWPPTYDASAPLSPAMIGGLSSATFSGRAQVLDVSVMSWEAHPAPPCPSLGPRPEGRPMNVTPRASLPPDGSIIRLYLDGAHTPRSMVEAAAWFLQAVDAREGAGRKILLFTCGVDKSAESMLSTLSAVEFDEVHIAAAVTGISAPPLPLAAGTDMKAPDRWLASLADSWNARSGVESAHVHATVGEALSAIRAGAAAGGGRLHVFVTGSLYLVGEVMSLIPGAAPL